MTEGGIVQEQLLSRVHTAETKIQPALQKPASVVANEAMRKVKEGYDVKRLIAWFKEAERVDEVRKALKIGGK